eukprot:scaffold1789_cov375-Prasinococcus_capsulatus_cf.AAC.5
MPEVEHRMCALFAGLAPDRVHFPEASSTPDMLPVESGASFQLRPELAESLFIFHRITGNATYRQWGWDLFSAMQKHCRTKLGFSAVHDVRSAQPEVSKACPATTQPCQGLWERHTRRLTPPAAAAAVRRQDAQLALRGDVQVPVPALRRRRRRQAAAAQVRAQHRGASAAGP